MFRSEALDQIAAALLAAQASFPEVVKDATGKILLKSGGSYEYGYATLTDLQRAVLPVLHRHGLAVTQGTENEDEAGFTVVTTVLHVSGQWIAGRVRVPLEQPTAQKAGSAITYGCRYGLRAVLCIITNDPDDDGAAASERGAPKPAAHHAPAAHPTPKAARANAATLYAGGGMPTKCPTCGGAIWDNRQKKASGDFKPSYPDWSCRDKECKTEGRRTAGWLAEVGPGRDHDVPIPEQEPY